MEVSINIPQCVDNQRTFMLPAKGQANAGTGMLAMGDNADVVNALHAYIEAHYKPGRNVTPTNFNEALDHAMTDGDRNVRSCDLAMLLLHGGGCLVAQMGDARVVQFRPSTRETLYDSRAQVLDIYSAKARVEQLTDVVAGDYFMLTSVDKYELGGIKRILADAAMGDDAKSAAISKELEANSRSKGAALYLVQVAEVKGMAPIFQFKDMNKAWAWLAAVLVVLVVVAAVLTFGKGALSGSQGNATTTEVDSDTIMPPVVTAPLDERIENNSDSIVEAQEKAAQDSIAQERARAIARAKAKAAEEAAAEDEIEVIHSSEPSSEPGSEPSSGSEPVVPGGE